MVTFSLFLDDEELEEDDNEDDDCPTPESMDEGLGITFAAGPAIKTLFDDNLAVFCG